MPPPMSADNDETPELTKNDLSDQAIELLYDIVRRAQSSPDRSSRALFNAYEEVLAEQGLAPQDDSILHRFLFYMQRDRVKDESLVQRFKRVLSKIDIIVECDSEGEGIEVTTNLDLENQNSLGRGHSRRGSFDSFFDGPADKVAGNGFEQELSIRTRRGSHSALANAKHEPWSKRRSRSDTEAQSYQQAQLPIRSGGSSLGNRIRSLDQGQPRQRRSGSVSSRGSIQIRRHGRTRSAQIGDFDADNSDRTEETDELDLSNIQIPGINAPIPPRGHKAETYPLEPFRLSDTRLIDDAEAFEYQRLHRVTRDFIQKWRNRTREQVERQEEMERLAVAFDRKIVLRIAFGQLLDAARVKQSNRETERFFGRLENRAEKARNLFLLTKAFTHWAKSTEDEVQRTSVARRHLLRTKFFNGWREITAVNEFKIQQFALGKFLRIWRSRTGTIRENRNFATFLYEENLLHRVYKDWFFKFCTIAAPAWRNDRTRRKTLQKWNEITVTLREREYWAEKKRNRVVLMTTLQSWAQRTTTAQSMVTQAQEFRHHALLSFGFYTLRKQAQLAPLLKQFQERASSRRIRTALQVWHHNLQLSRQARSVDQVRVMRNAWTAWNDRLRIKALEERINDRILVESLYKWTLASRVSLFRRVHNRQLKESMFLTWATKTAERTNTLEAAERRFAQFKRNQMLRSCLQKLETATAERRREEYAVTAEYQQRLKQRVFGQMIRQHERFQQLSQWARDARFYVLATNTLKTWNKATQHARRNRRREMYARVRRTVKVNLVRRFFEIWKEKATIVAEQDRHASDIAENRILHTTTELLAHWRSRTGLVQQGEAIAHEVHINKLQSRSLQVWTQRMETIQAMEARGLALRQENTELVAASALKKLGWKIWNVRRQEENARALYERNFKKHTRAMIRFWLEQTNERLANRVQSPTPRSRSRGRAAYEEDDDGVGGGRGVDELVELDDPGEDTRRLEAWTAFDETALGLHSNLDLSLSLSPKNNPPPTTTTSTTASASAPRHHFPPYRRPQTFPQPHSALRPPPIPEDPLDFADPSAFWASTPMAPTVSKPKPGYLKTPSKRSVARAKRPALPPSPEKRGPFGMSLGRGERGTGIEMGAMSAPPVQGGWRDGRAGFGSGVTSFERRLRDGGFDRRGQGRERERERAREQERGVRETGTGKGRVGFGYVSEFE